MPRPTSPIELVKRHGFPFEGWKSFFGPFDYFRARGYSQMLVPLEATFEKTRDQVKRYVKDYLGVARDSMQGDWQNVLRDSSWGTLREEHIGKCASSACRFDKAILAIVCLEKAFEAARLPHDIYQHVEICPAIYILEGLDKRLIDQLARTPSAGHRSLLGRISVEMGYISDPIDKTDASVNKFASLLGEMADGYPVTLPVVSLLHGHFINNNLATGMTIRRLKSRTDFPFIKPGKEKRPSNFEQIPVNWTSARAALPEHVRNQVEYLAQEP